MDEAKGTLLTTEEKIKALTQEQQIYIKGLIDGALLHNTSNNSV